MAKKAKAKATAKPEDGGLLSDRIERQQMAQRVKAARDKIARGETPSGPELRALNKFELEQLKTFGQKYLAAMPKSHFLDLFLGSSKVYINWRDSFGFPWPPKGDEGVDLKEVLKFYRTRFVNGNGSLPSGADEDDVLFQFASQDLKDELIRHRIREKEVTNQIRTIELQKALEGWAPIEPIKEWHNSLAELVLRTREKVVKGLDGEQKEYAEQAFDDLGDDMQRLTEEQFGDSSPEKP